MAKKKSKSRNAKQPTAAKLTPTSDSINDDVLAAAINSVHPPVLMKVCRLCETKDGPFLNIFDADKVTAKKIEELMPFGIAENDNLPHKICFRCSAKVEELHEFIQKCIKAQENLRSALGNLGPLNMKPKPRVLWEEHLNKTKLSNDDICDVLIKRAMEGIPLIAPLDEIKEEIPLASKKSKVEPPVEAKEMSEETSESDDDADDVSLNQVKLAFDKTVDPTPATRTSRSQNQNSDASLLDGLEPVTRKGRTYPGKKSKHPVPENKQAETNRATTPEVDKSKKDEEEKPEEPPPKPQEKVPPFNIMDHVSTIKVNSVGILFQCHLCNRNFLKKDIVMNHGCAKNSVPKEINLNTAPVPEPPKPPTVKYIKMDKNFNKPLADLVDKKVEKAQPVPEPEVTPKPKPRPKAGPASKVKHEPPKVPKEPNPPPKPVPQEAQVPAAPSVPSVHFPNVPSLNSRYKLVPGPNNTFTLVEETSAPEMTPQEKQVEQKPQQKTKKRKTLDTSGPSTKQRKESPKHTSSSPEVIDLDMNQDSQSKPEPYPVGLFQPIPHHSSVYPPSHPPVPFTTPAMKKQSYTIVQTGNPSKLLISTKPQAVAETSKKKKKKTESDGKEPYRVSSEDSAQPKDSGFFTFISVDPLVQPSYVLPTDNIIQESQITTSTSRPVADKEKEKYPCNMCGENFSREKKLLAHIQSHYNQMDEEDQKRTGSKPGPKRKTRKS